ncbi:MAG: AAA family ATPase [Candidatus Cloacimonetes bacterium]|nr:AAA family ATPase [Candidatus Cloacimonadota bacterium]
MKKFNITGTCIPDENFMVNISDKLEQVMALIKMKKYIVINRPRQYGKTTTLAALRRLLADSDEYVATRLSFEGVGDLMFSNEERFCKSFLGMLARDSRIKKNGYGDLFNEKIDKITGFETLSLAITEIMSSIDKKIILIIDEVDKSRDNQIFISFLGLLREKYLNAREGDDITFHSVILAGLYDIKSLKLQIRPEAEKKYNSPWNIAVEFTADMSFSPLEIESMLLDYVETTGRKMDIKSVSEKIHFWTNGYPFLVSKLCKMVDEELLPKREHKNWDVVDIEWAVSKLMQEMNTLFESLAKNLEDIPKLFELIKSVLVGHEEINFSLMDPIINFAKLYGMIIPDEYNKIRIHNKIFEEVMTEYFVTKIMLSNYEILNKVKEPYIKKDGNLDFRMVMLKFQETIKEKYNSHDYLKSDKFLENELRMLFMVFLKPILNGIGFCFKEVQTGAEKRLDLVVLFKKQKFVVEMKIWRGDEYHKAGIIQLKNYMQAESVQEGYMLISNKNRTKDFYSADEDGIFCVYI